MTLPVNTAGEQYSRASSYGGSYISLSTVQPGDLVFFGSSSSSIDHVGIVVSGTGTSANIISAVNEEDGITTHTVHWFEAAFSWDGAVAIPGVGSPVSGGGSEASKAQMFIRSDGAVFAKEGTAEDGGWTEEVHPGEAKAIAVSTSGAQMFIRSDGAVFAKQGIGEDGGWTEEVHPSEAKAVAVGPNGAQMFIRSDGAVFAKQGIAEDGGWTEEVHSGEAKAIAIGKAEMFLRADGALFAKEGIAEDGGWTEEVHSGEAKAIAAGANGAQMFIRSDGALFAKEGIAVDGGWTRRGPLGRSEGHRGGCEWCSDVHQIRRCVVRERRYRRRWGLD